MITSVYIEFLKTRRRKIWLIMAALIGTQILWTLWGMNRMDSQELSTGWQYALYQFPLLNTILMPTIVAVLASRICDLEHKGQTFRLLETVMTAGKLFDAKFLNGAIYILVITVFQVFVILVTGLLLGFPQEVPVVLLGGYLLFTSVVSLTIFLFQLLFSLLFTNQMIALSVGLIGSFVGLFSLFFPAGIQKFILWSYYGELLFVRMDWNPETRVSNFFWIPFNWSGFVIILTFFCAVYLVGRYVFSKKEF